MGDTYDSTRDRLERYFDGTANEAWTRLMSDAPVSRIRQTVREGRAAMRAELLSRLPADLRGARVLDAGCGAGQLTREIGARGAHVVGADISPKLLHLAARQMPPEQAERVQFHHGDMLAAHLGRFDYVVAMDSLIHYRARDIVVALEGLAPRVSCAVVFTVAPRTPLLAAMHAAGKLFPRGDRSPAIEPVAPARLARQAAGAPGLAGWRLTAGARVARGFYISQAMEARHP